MGIEESPESRQIWENFDILALKAILQTGLPALGEME